MQMRDLYRPIRGYVTRIVRDSNGIVLSVDESHNLVVTTGRGCLPILLASADNNKRVNQMSWGDQGHNPLSPSEPLPVLPEETHLNHEILRKSLMTYSFPSTTSVMFVARIEGSELIGSSISEAMLISVDGTAFAINRFGLMYHSIGIVFEFRWTIEF